MNEHDYLRENCVHGFTRKFDTRFLGQSSIHNNLFNQLFTTCIIGLKVPEELWLGHNISYDRLCTFGYEAYAHVPKELHAKLDSKSQNCIFIGYGLDGHFGYQLWDLESQSVICNNDVVFNET